MNSESKKPKVWVWGTAAFLMVLALYPASFLLAVGLSGLGLFPDGSREILNKVYAPALRLWGVFG
jgi:hypothetical protein